MNVRHIVIDTGLSDITLVADGDAVTGLYFRHHIRRPPQEAFGPEVVPSTDPLLSKAARQVRAYLAGELMQFDLPLEAEGNAFQHRVWKLAAEIPRGTTTTYGRLAEQLGDGSLAVQVGQALAANPLCILVPCHRVVGSDGSLTGYAGGLKRKQALIDLEEPAGTGASRLF